MMTEFEREIWSLREYATQSGQEEVLSQFLGWGKMGPYNAALRNCRARLGLRLKDTAERVGVTIGLVGQLERLRIYPSTEMTWRISQVLGMEPEQIFPPWLRLFTRERVRPKKKDKLELTASDIGENKFIETVENSTERDLTISIYPQPEEEAEKRDLEDEVDTLLHCLPTRQQKILELWFGLAGEGVPMTQEAIGRRMGISKAMVSQIIIEAIKKLRHPSRAWRLMDYYPEEPSIPWSIEVLWNGVVNALYFQEKDRALRNLKRIEERILGKRYPDSEKFWREINEYQRLRIQIQRLP